jgi:hypothetical protein
MPIKLFRPSRGDRAILLKAATIVGILPMLAASAMGISAQQALTSSNGIRSYRAATF